MEQAAANLAAAVDDTLGFSVPEEGSLSHADEYMPDFMELMAKGIRDSGKLVMQSVRELSASMGAAFTNLSMPEFQMGQLAMAGGGGVSNTHNTVNMGGLSVVVNGYEAKNDSDLADTIIDRINEMFHENGSVWGR